MVAIHLTSRNWDFDPKSMASDRKTPSRRFGNAIVTLSIRTDALLATVPLFTIWAEKAKA
ncbi:MAG TPA: hypothetical protein VIL58_01450 [Thermoplasmata archaeon]